MTVGVRDAAQIPTHGTVTTVDPIVSENRSIAKFPWLPGATPAPGSVIPDASISIIKSNTPAGWKCVMFMLAVFVIEFHIAGPEKD